MQCWEKNEDCGDKEVKETILLDINWPAKQAQRRHCPSSFSEEHLCINFRILLPKGLKLVFHSHRYGYTCIVPFWCLPFKPKIKIQVTFSSKLEVPRPWPGSSPRRKRYWLWSHSRSDSYSSSAGLGGVSQDRRKQLALGSMTEQQSWASMCWILPGSVSIKIADQGKCALNHPLYHPVIPNFVVSAGKFWWLEHILMKSKERWPSGL